MWIVKFTSLPVGPSSERDKFHACFSLTKDPSLETTTKTTLAPMMAFSMSNVQSTVILNSKYLRFPVPPECAYIESWDHRTCSVAVIWTGRSWRNTRGVVKHARGENTRGKENTRGEKIEERNPLFSYFSLAPVVSPALRVIPRCVLSRAVCYPALRVMPRCVLSRAAFSVISDFSERHAFSRCTGVSSFKLRRIASLIWSTI